MFDHLLSEKDYAAARGISVRTAQRDRALGIGPPFIRVGRRIFYRPEAIEAWLIAQEETPPRSPVRRGDRAA